jgi:hypothetical protein
MYQNIIRDNSKKGTMSSPRPGAQDPGGGVFSPIKIKIK